MRRRLHDSLPLRSPAVGDSHMLGRVDEWAATAAARGFHSSPAIMGVVGRGAVPRYLGVIGLLIPLVIFMYYGLVESWCLRYAWAYASGAMGSW